MEVDLGGSAGSYEGFLLARVRPPWPRDVTELWPEHPAMVLAKAAGWRVQAVDGAGSDADGVVARFWRARDGHYESDEPTRHVLLCTHGARDRCCGSLGTRLYSELSRQWDRPESLWRTSHLGGHRFAPTGLLLPEGTMWGYLDARSLTSILDRTCSAIEAAQRYRGCTLLRDRRVQVADRAVFARAGWRWLDSPRSGSVLAFTDDEALVEVHSESDRYIVRLATRARLVPNPHCGSSRQETAPLEAEIGVLEVTCS